MVLVEKRTQEKLNSIFTAPRGSYLFTGQEQLGKFTVAKELARRMSSNGQEITQGAVDVLVVEPTGKSIGIEEVQETEKKLALKSRTQHLRGVIVNDAHKLTLPAQNALLKTLEEPPEGTIVILISSQVDKLLPTIRSRCKIINFIPPAKTDLVEHLVQNYQLDNERALDVATTARGKPGQAISMLTEKEYLEYHQKLDKLSTRMLSANINDRLLLGQHLLKDEKLILEDFAQTLLGKCREQIYNAQASELPALQKKLKTIVDYLGYLEVNANKKIAFTNLMVNL